MNPECKSIKRIIYKPDGTFRTDGRHVVKNWLGHYEHFFTVVLGRPISYHVKPRWSIRYLKVGHNLIILERKNKENLENS